ncbi:MAG: beta-ketoacyl-[acyl-carrier-protein] synthase family protein [Oscillospiraceae bacterium]
MQKVLVTGLGAVTSIGHTVPEYWQNLIDGKCGIDYIKRISTEEHDTKVAAEVDDSFEVLPKKYWKKRQLNTTTRMERMALASAGEAIDDSGLDFGETDRSRVGIIYGIINNSYVDAEKDDPLNLILKDTPSVCPALISLKYGLTGAAFNVSTACASSAYAASLGSQFIKSGLCDIVIIGGMGSSVSHYSLSGFNQIMAMSVSNDPQKASAPFTLNRDGFIMGEGGATMVLESEESAKKRGAKIYCELAGSALYTEAFNLTAPMTDGIGMEKTMRMALEDAGITPDEVDYINAHGTSTYLNDLYETMAIQNLFGERAESIPVSSIKGAIGHTLGAGGALEGIACAKAIETGILPPTIHFDEPDPKLTLDYIPNVAREKKIDVAISNSFGFGGHNATLVFRRYTD